jgi:hypothetical protein
MAASFETNRGLRGAHFFRPAAARDLTGDSEPMDGAGSHFRLTFDKITELYQ